MVEVPQVKYKKSQSAFKHVAPDILNKLPLLICSMKTADVFKRIENSLGFFRL